jgi:predicted PurR-regulated permease PerM
VSSDQPSDVSGPYPTLPGTKPPHWIRRFAKLWGFAAFVIVVAIFFRHVLLPFVLACMVAYILAPAVNRMSSWHLRGRRVPRGAAVIVCYVVLLAVLGLFFGGFLPKLSGDFAALGREAPRLWERLNREWAPRVAHWLEERFPSLQPGPAPPPVDESAPREPAVKITPLPGGEYALVLPENGLEIEQDGGRIVLRPREVRPRKGLEERFREWVTKSIAGLEGQVDDVIRFGQAILLGAIGLIMKFVLVLMVAAFILVDLERLHGFARGLIPGRYRGDYDVVVRGIDRGLNGVIRGQLLICLVNGILTYVGLLIFQVKYSLLLAAVAAIMSLIPIFGSILSTIPIVAIALVSGAAEGEGLDLLRGVFILGWILGIHFVEANFLNPHILGQAARIHPVLVIFALIAGEHSYGLVGALLAVPVASIIQTLFVFFRSRTWKTDANVSSSSVPIITGKPP